MWLQGSPEHANIALKAFFQQMCAISFNYIHVAHYIVSFRSVCVDFHTLLPEGHGLLHNEK